MVLSTSITPIPSRPWVHDQYWHHLRERDRATVDSTLALVDAGQLGIDEANALLAAWKVRL